MSTRTIVFDLDGTLVDSVPDLAPALNRLLAARGLAPFDLPTVASFVGDGARVLVERAFAARDGAPQPGDVERFVADYTDHASEATRPYPGVAETLAALQAAGWRMAVCTNKPEAAARLLLADLGLASFFAAIGGGDSFAVRKPDPAHLLATLAAAGGEAQGAVMVGDHRNDIHAATGAGMPTIFAAWGYSPREAADGAAEVAERLADVPPLAERLSAGT